MGHHHHGHAVSGQLSHGIEHLLHPFGIEGTGGFVEQHHLRIQSQGAGDRHPLLLAAAQLRGKLVRLLSDPHLIEQLDGPLLSLRFGSFLHLHRRQGDVVED